MSFSLFVLSVRPSVRPSVLRPSVRFCLSVCLSLSHPRHPSHLCQDPDSISCTFLEQFVLAFQTAISHQYPIVNPIQSNPSDQDTKSRCEIKDFSENLIVSPFLSKSLPPGVQEKGKSLGADLPPKGLENIQG